MRKAAVVLALAIAAAIGGYLAWAGPRLPATVAVGTAYAASREEFTGILGAAGALILAALLAGAWRRPNAAGLAPLGMALVGGFVYGGLEGRPGLALAALGAALLIVLLAFRLPKPKPRRVQPF